MALMERIVRPHVPIDTGPVKQPPKCREKGGNSVYQFTAPPEANRPLASVSPGPQRTPQPDLQDKKLNSSWAYAYKKYMTKKEKEEDKCADMEKGEDRVVGGQATDKAAESDSDKKKKKSES